MSVVVTVVERTVREKANVCKVKYLSERKRGQEMRRMWQTESVGERNGGCDRRGCDDAGYREYFSIIGINESKR